MELVPAWLDTSLLLRNAWIAGKEVLAANFAPIMMEPPVRLPIIPLNLLALSVIILLTISSPAKHVPFAHSLNASFA